MHANAYEAGSGGLQRRLKPITQELGVSKHAVVRRVEAIDPEPGDWTRVFGLGREAVWSVIRHEIANARLLRPRSHQLFSHPGRVRWGATGRQCWVNGFLYLVEKTAVVTCCCLEPAQFESIQQSEGEDCPFTDVPLLNRDDFMRAVQQAQADLSPVSSVRSQKHGLPTVWEPQILEQPSMFDRSVLKLPRWWLQGSLDLIVVPSDVMARGHSRLIVDQIARWIRDEFKGVPPNFVWLDPTSATATPLMAKFRQTQSRPLPVELLSGPSDPLFVSRPSFDWWRKVLRGDETPTQGKLLMVVTPSSACKILELMSGMPSVPWDLPDGISRSPHAEIARWGRVLRIKPKDATNRFSYQVSAF